MKTCLFNGIILDGSAEMKPQKGQIILIDGQKIVKITEQTEKALDQAKAEGFKMIDLDGKYVMPGMINMHVHLPASGTPSAKQKDNAKLVKFVMSNPVTRLYLSKMYETNARTQLLSGVTTIRTVGGVADYDTKLRDKINEGKVVGPRLLAANMAVSVPDGHMAGSLAYIAHTPEEARDFVKKILADKPDLIKLMITGGVLDAKDFGEPGVLKMSPEIVAAACEEAHKAGLPVAAHVESAEGCEVAVRNGVDTIEHGAVLEGDKMELFREHGACQVLTLSPALPFAKLDRSVSFCSEMDQYNSDFIIKNMIASAKKLLEMGIPVGLGTDTGCPFINHTETWREAYYFHTYCGVSNTFALHTITQVNAQIARLGDVTGTVAEGFDADLIVTEKNPLDNLKNLANVKVVIARGHVIENPKVTCPKKIKTAIDSYLD